MPPQLYLQLCARPPCRAVVTYTIKTNVAVSTATIAIVLLFLLLFGRRRRRRWGLRNLVDPPPLTLTHSVLSARAPPSCSLVVVAEQGDL